MRPSKEMICLKDIMQSLSHTVRFRGHMKIFYSVGLHLINCSNKAVGYIMPLKELNNLKLELLIHDFSEAYYGDLPAPVKRLLGEEYTKAEKKCQKIINKMILGYEDLKYPQIVDVIDKKMAATEARFLCNYREKWWNESDTYPFEQQQYSMSDIHVRLWLFDLLCNLMKEVNNGAFERILGTDTP